MGVVLTLLGITIVLIVIAFLSYYEGLQFACAFLAVVLGLVTLMTSIERNVEERWVLKDVEIVRTSRVVLIDDGDSIYKYKSHDDYESITDSSKFYLLMATNVYGFEYIDDKKYVNE